MKTSKVEVVQFCERMVLELCGNALDNGEAFELAGRILAVMKYSEPTNTDSLSPDAANDVLSVADWIGALGHQIENYMGASSALRIDLARWAPHILEVAGKHLFADVAA